MRKKEWMLKDEEEGKNVVEKWLRCGESLLWAPRF